MKRVIPFVLVLMCSVASADEMPATALAADPVFMAKVASYHGMTPMRLANQSEDHIRQMVLDYLEAQRTKQISKPSKPDANGSGASMNVESEVR